METLKKYLDMMFSDLPDTPNVNKAKADLWNMMEDKYEALLAEGKTETEAVGVVIAEFGNLDEVADDLGLSSYMDGSYQENEADDYSYAQEESIDRGPRPEEVFGHAGGTARNYYDEDDKDEDDDTVLGLIQSVFWPTVVAIYLIWSFITFDWGRTWVIWPIAAGLQILLNVFRKIWK